MVMVVTVIFMILVGPPLLFLGLLALGGFACGIGAALPPPPPAGTVVPGMITIDLGVKATLSLALDAVEVFAENLPQGAEAGATCELAEPAAVGDIICFLVGGADFVSGIVLQISDGPLFQTNQIGHGLVMGWPTHDQPMTNP